MRIQLPLSCNTIKFYEPSFVSFERSLSSFRKTGNQCTYTGKKRYLRCKALVQWTMAASLKFIYYVTLCNLCSAFQSIIYNSLLAGSSNISAQILLCPNEKSAWKLLFSNNV